MYDEYVCKCPECGGDLFVTTFVASTRIPVEPDGFSTTDADFLDTSEETVACESCEYKGSLQMRETEWPTTSTM